MTHPPITFLEIQHSITGFDEIAVTKQLGVDVYDTAVEKMTLFRRCLVFIHQRHQGASDADAKATALGMTFADVFEYFADEPDEPVPDEPVTDLGKGSTSPDAGPNV